MEQRNQMLRELRLNKKESMGVVSVPNGIFFISHNLLDYLLLLLNTAQSFLFMMIKPSEKLPFLPKKNDDFSLGYVKGENVELSFFRMGWCKSLIHTHWSYTEKYSKCFSCGDDDDKNTEKGHELNFCSSHYAMSNIICYYGLFARSSNLNIFRWRSYFLTPFFVYVRPNFTNYY